MPIESCHVDRGVVVCSKSAAPGANGQDGEQRDPDDHVERMQSGHDEIKRKENLRVSRVRVLTRMTGNFFVFKAERRAGDVVFVKLIFVFLTLNAEESEAKQHGENEAADHEPAS